MSGAASMKEQLDEKLDYLAAKSPLFRKVLARGNRMNLISYVLFFVFLMFVYIFVSGGDFSFMLVLGATCRSFAFVLLLWKVWHQESCSGVSLKTLELYAVSYSFRLVSILTHEGYLPFDRSGDWFYQIIELVGLCAVGANMYLALTKFKPTYNEALDSFGAYQVPARFGALYLVVPAFLLAMIFHPSLNNSFIADTSWTFALYLEAVAVLPQLFLFVKKGGEVETFTSHYIFSLGIARVLELVFWLSSYVELNSARRANRTYTSGFAGSAVMLAQIVHLCVMADYMYHYVRSLKSGGPMTLPSFAEQNI